MCDLCTLDEETKWYTERNAGESSLWTVVDCRTCRYPMAVYRHHTMKAPAIHLKYLYDLILNTPELFGYLNWRLQARSITGHLHIHLFREVM